jgi:hypothetical protein
MVGRGDAIGTIARLHLYDESGLRYDLLHAQAREGLDASL